MKEILGRDKDFGYLVRYDPKNVTIVNTIHFLCGGLKKDLPAYVFPVKILEAKKDLPCTIDGFDIIADGSCSHYKCGKILDNFYVNMLLEDGKYKDMKIFSKEDIQEVVSKKDLSNPIFINKNGKILDSFSTSDDVFFVVEANVCLHERCF